MPLTGTYEWVDRIDTINVVIPLKGVAPSKVDIVATKSTLKVNYSPYIIDVVLSGQIDPIQHKARVKNGSLTITLKKIVASKWDSFVNTSVNASAIKAASLAEHAEFEKEQASKRKDRQINDERYSTRSQMAVDEKERNRLDTLKLEEKTRAEEEVYKTFEELEKTRAKNMGAIPAKAPAKETVFSRVEEPAEGSFSKAKNSSSIFTDDDIDVDADDLDALLDERLHEDSDLEDGVSEKEDKTKPVTSHIFENVNNGDDLDDDVVYVPPPRQATKVELNFTPRIFPTPMRESAKAQEDNWIAKNRKHLKKHGVYSAAHQAMLKNKGAGGGNISEEDPVWLKAKGDEYFRHSDYLSAINAYSTALDIDENMVSCYANRSICYLAQQMYGDCVEDCDDAVRLVINQHTSKNAEGQVVHALSEHSLADNQMLVKLYMRKATAKCQLGLYENAISSYELAETFHKEAGDFIDNPANADKVSAAARAVRNATDKVLGPDLAKIRLLRDAEVIKNRADKHIADGEVDAAMAAYSQALDMIPVYVSCLSNRSACHLAKGNVQACIDDCSLAITLLQHSGKPSNGAGAAGAGLIVLGSKVGGDSQQTQSMLEAILPPEGSDKRKQWLLKTVVRRGAAYFQKGCLDEAVADYGYASSLDQRNEDLKRDLTRITNTRALQQSKKETAAATPAVGTEATGVTVNSQATE
jgi:dyslexia susceptibility 1 candidate gene 1 protein